MNATTNVSTNDGNDATADTANPLDLGLGTAYERVAIYQLFDRWTHDVDVRRACEGPVDGMAGIPGLHLLGLARQGTDVEVALPEDAALARVRRLYETCGAADRLTTTRLAPGSFPRGTYDLAVTYNALPLIPDWREYLRRFFAIEARRYIVVVSNPASYGVQLRRAQRLLTRARTRELFDHEATQRDVIEPALRRFGRIVDHRYLDCPWWPDFLIPAKNNLAGEVLGTLRALTGKKARGEASNDAAPAKGAFVFGETRYPFFADQPEYEETRRAIGVHPVFDTAPEALARTFGHLHGYLVERKP